MVICHSYTQEFSSFKEMKLIELIDYMIDRHKLNQLCLDLNLPDDQSDDSALIYINNNLALDSDIILFTNVETDDLVLFEKDGIEYKQFFPLFYAADLIEFDLDLLGKAIVIYIFVKG